MATTSDENTAALTEQALEDLETGDGTTAVDEPPTEQQQPAGLTTGKASAPPPPAAAIASTAITPVAVQSGIATPPRLSAADMGRHHREPTDEEMATFLTIQDVSTWKGVST